MFETFPAPVRGAAKSWTFFPFCVTGRESGGDGASGEAINTHRTDVTENPQIDDEILKIFVLHMYLSTAFLQIELISITNI